MVDPPPADSQGPPPCEERQPALIEKMERLTDIVAGLEARILSHFDSVKDRLTKLQADVDCLKCTRTGVEVQPTMINEVVVRTIGHTSSLVVLQCHSRPYLTLMHIYIHLPHHRLSMLMAAHSSTALVRPFLWYMTRTTVWTFNRTTVWTFNPPIFHPPKLYSMLPSLFVIIASTCTIDLQLDVPV